MHRRPTFDDLGLLAVAIVSVSSSAVLVRWSDAPVMAMAFWRTVGGAVLLGPAAWSHSRSGDYRLRDHLRWVLLGGAALALHFITWLTSLELTSVAASVTLVTTVPLFVAAWLWFRGRTPTMRTWAAIALALTGASLFTVSDWATTPGSFGGDAFIGDGLALCGAAAMATYLMTSERLREHLPTTAYAGPLYGVAAAILLLVAIVTNTDLVGFDTKSWVAIVAMILGPQLLGHTLLNELLGRVGPMVVSVALLFEPVAASAMVWVLFGDAPPAIAWLATPLVLLGLTLRVTESEPLHPSSDSLP